MNREPYFYISQKQTLQPQRLGSVHLDILKAAIEHRWALYSGDFLETTLFSYLSSLGFQAQYRESLQ
jgi:hypothetical protein